MSIKELLVGLILRTPYVITLTPNVFDHMSGTQHNPNLWEHRSEEGNVPPSQDSHWNEDRQGRGQQLIIQLKVSRWEAVRTVIDGCWVYPRTGLRGPQSEGLPVQHHWWDIWKGPEARSDLGPKVKK
jgi:hypothetical protein